MAKKSVSTELYRRSYILLIFIIGAFAVLSARIIILQTKNYEKYQRAVISQMTTESVIPAKRGDIYDANGVLLATDITVYRVFISPKDIQTYVKGDEKEKIKPHPGADTVIADKLAELFDVSPENVTEKMKKVNRLDETIAKNVDDDTAKVLRNFIDENDFYNLIHIEPTAKRYYCYDSLASSVLGFTGSDNNGLYGLEYQYDKELSGTNGVYVTARDSYGNEMPTEYESYIDEIDGYKITLTLNLFIQSVLENQLRATFADNGADERVCGIVMDVNDAAILGMSTIPDFNCNDPWTLDSYFTDKLEKLGYAEESDEFKKAKNEFLQTSWSNKAITSTYMPGSTFKVITTAMCLEEKVVDINEQMYCPGYFMVPGYSRPIHCHVTKGHGSQTFARALQQSCNPALMTIGLRLGSEKFYEYFQAFGYMEKTGIDLPGEGNSIFHSPENFNQVELATASFGQNFAVTALQQIRGIAAVANGGYVVTPYLVKEMKDSDGNVVYSHSSDEKVRQVVSAEVCKTVTEILEEGVSGDGGAKNAYVAGYRVAAKTGTTEKKDKENALGGTYRVGSTVAFAPAEDPKVAVLIMVDEPSKGSVYGSVVAAPYVANVMSEILPYLGVEAVYTEKELENLTKTMPNYKGWSVEDAIQNLTYRGIAYEVVGDGERVTKTAPTGGSSIRKDGIVYLYAGDVPKSDMISVPDLVGKSATVANLMITNSRLNINITGTTNYEAGAVVVSQSPDAGELVPRGTLVTVNFRYLDGTD